MHPSIQPLADQLRAGDPRALARAIRTIENREPGWSELLKALFPHSGHARIRALGVLAPAIPPYWLGARAVTELSLTTLRHIGPDVKSRTIPRFGHATPGSRLRHGFVVYSGGRQTPPEERTG